MKAKVGIVQAINDGKFFAKDSSENTKELRNGDIIYENDVVFSDGSNSSSAQITVALEGEDIIVLKNGVQQLFDSSLIASTFGNEEMVFAKESIDAMLDSHSDVPNVWSNLNEEGFSGYQDVTEEETAAGEEDEEVLEEGSIGQFALRDGALVDVISDLRKKSWVRTQDYREVENSEALEEASLKPLGGIDYITTVTPPPPTPVTPPPVTPPTVTPPPPTPVPIANLIIDDITMYEQDGYMVFTLTLDRPANGNISVNFATSNGTAEAGKDYTHTTGVITIPNGSTTAQIRIPINDDYYYEKSEQFNVTLTNPTGNVNIVKPVGVGTILDNPPTTGETPTPSNTPDSETGTYDSGDTVFVKIVNSATTIEDMTGHMSPIVINGVKNDGILEHFLQLVDKNGKFVEIPDGKSITVTLEYSSFQGTIDNSDFDNSPIGASNKVEITLTKDNLIVNHDGTLSYKITNHAIIEAGAIPAEDLESYYIKITDVKQNGDTFENVIIHKNFDTVTGTIIDVTPTLGAVKTPEDTAKDISLTETSKTISKMLVDNGKGFVEVSNGDKVDLYDNGKVIGTITYDQGGNKFTFTPNEDYSNYKNSDDIKFMYFADFGDNTNEFKQVSVQVTPVVDAPEINFDTTKGTMNGTEFIVKTKEDDNNTKEGSHKIALGLITPKLSKDQTDKNGAAGDHPERNGEITLKFTNGSSVSGAKLFNGNSEVANISSNNQEIKVVIVKTSGGTDIDTSYHHSGTLPEKGANVLYLTKTEYENLKIQHKEDNDTDIKINIGITSYELDDNNKPLSSVPSSSVDKNMTVEILPVTDNISIKWDNNSKGTISNNDKTYTFTPVDKKQNTTLDIKAIMSNTNGAGTDTKPDLDGSEKRTYIVDGLPTGTKVTIGGQVVTVGADGKATIVFNDTNNKANDPDFKIELPQYYQGTVNGTITLKVQDKGVEESSDSSKWGVEKTDTVNFKINVMPAVIDDPSNKTIQIAQAIGNEDAGRGKNNVLNSNGTIVSSSGNITNPEIGLKLNIEPKGSNLGAKGETATIWIDKVPVGGAMWVFDKSAGTTGSYKLIGVEGVKVYEYTKDSNNEYTVKTELLDGKSGNISVSLNGDNTYKVQILDYQNSKLPTFVPPHNDDKDYTFKISGEKVSSAIIDGQTVVSKEQYNSGNPLDMSIIVKNIADEPINTELVDSSDKIVEIGGTKYIKATEDEIFNLKDIYKNGTPSSFDKDGSEVLSIKITLPAGVTILNGTKYKIDGNEYVIKSTDLDNIKLVFDKNFSGTTGDIKLKYITTETSGENSSKTHFEQNLKLFLTPVAEAEISKSTTGDEDSIFKVDFNIAHKNGDTNETLESVWIKASDVTSKDFTLYIGNDGSKVAITTLTLNAEGYYELTSSQWNNIYAENTTEHTHGNYKFDVKYSVKDTANGVSDIKTSEFPYELNIKAVTDAPTLTIGNIETTNTSKVIITDKTVTIKEPSAEFKVPLTTTSNDKDGSETVQEIVISGVPQGVEVVGATYYGYNGSIHNGIWVIKNPSDKILNSDGASSEITFKVNPGSNFEERDIKITTYIKDSGDAKVESASQTIRIEKDPSYVSGPGTGTPPLFNLSTQLTTIFEDNDSDPKTDGNQDEYNLGKSILVANAGGSTSGNYAVTITDFPAGTTVTGYDYSYVEGGKTFYVVVGNGNATDVMTKLSNVIVTPPKDMNTGGDTDGKMKFNATISTFDGGVFQQGTPINNHENNITPVTDHMTITITANSINEDGTSNININLSNPSDGSKTSLGDTLTITVVENWKDIADGGGANGTLTVPAGYTIIGTSIDANGNTVYSIKKSDGSNFSVGDINGLTYTPATNRDGEVKFEISVQNKETGSSVILDSKGDKTIIVAPVIDTVLTASTVVATGTEDLAIAGINLANPLKVTITADGTNSLVITDKSETLGNIVLDKIPNGMTVWYKDTNGTLKMATNIGTSTGTYVLNPNGDNTPVSVNKWLIPTVGSNVIPEIYVNAPENWAGNFNFDIKLSIYEQNLSTPIEKTINTIGTITAVADGFESASATKSTKNVFQWADLQLNANMKDTDGSEVMNVELSGLSVNAQFKLKNGSLTNPAVWDGSKWTISGIKVEDINKIQFMDIKATTSVTADIWTKEQSNSVESDKTSLTGLAEIKAVTGTFTFDKELSLDFDNIGSLADGSIMNNVTKLDLGSSNAAKNELLNLTLQDVLDMGKKDGNGNINLEILGGGMGPNQDKVTFKNSSEWKSEILEETIDSKTFKVYTSTDENVKVKIQTDIETLI